MQDQNVQLQVLSGQNLESLSMEEVVTAYQQLKSQVIEAQQKLSKYTLTPSFPLMYQEEQVIQKEQNIRQQRRRERARRDRGDRHDDEENTHEEKDEEGTMAEAHWIQQLSLISEGEILRSFFEQMGDEFI